ncbi:MAG: AAA family ATPase [Patescibacteria group bacterium]
MPRGRPKGSKNNNSQHSEQSEITNNKKAEELKDAVDLIDSLDKKIFGEIVLKEEKKIELTKEQLEKQEKLKRIMTEINKEYKDPEMCKFAKDEPSKESVYFGHKQLDDFLGGGAVYGNFVIFWGDVGTGKTTLALMQIAQAQKMGKICAYLDLEHTLDKERMKLFGVNVENLVLIENCESAEQAMNIVIRLAKEKVVDLIVIDSIQAMSTREEQVSGKGEKIRSMEEAEMASLAKKMGKFLRRTATPIYKAKIAVLMIGQARTGGLGTFITKDELTGGRAIKFWAIMLVYMRKGQGVDSPTEKIELDELDEKGNSKWEEIKIGFSTVLIIQKTKKGNSKPELSELRIPYYFSTGFVK